MAEKYNLPGPGTRPLFFRHPGVGGVVAGPGFPLIKPPAAQPAAVLIGHAPGKTSVIGAHHHRIIRIVIENPANHPIPKQSVISLVRIICIERTWRISAPLCPLLYYAAAMLSMMG